eukprot:2440593-Prymnesium_polylepis.1
MCIRDRRYPFDPLVYPPKGVALPPKVWPLCRPPADLCIPDRCRLLCARLLPILGKLLSGRQPALDHALLRGDAAA